MDLKKAIQKHVGVPADGIFGPQTIKAIAKAFGISEAVYTLKDPGAFFASVRKITGPLNTTQVETINGLLTSAAHWPLGWMAYGLATAWHEARLMPIEEIGKGKGKPYGRIGKHGQAPYGRGLVQLTHDVNYEWADEAVAEAGLLPRGAILADFSLVMRPDIAAFILVKGMETGAFTGKGLADDIGPRGTVEEFTRGRRTINGTDRAALIAGYAVQFQDALVSGGYA
ncbi:hypothetical protein [Novosphingobium sp. HII-3]|uniref:hypothetical protein n=1 Tax=Novosphingobium sp. HII-3 TaxID=2075565 RepID=UPI0018EB8A09|nr:hypothetical protein [Novosphingobium sp. HII-3]